MKPRTVRTPRAMTIADATLKVTPKVTPLAPASADHVRTTQTVTTSMETAPAHHSTLEAAPVR